MENQRAFRFLKNKALFLTLLKILKITVFYTFIMFNGMGFLLMWKLLLVLFLLVCVQ